VSRLTVQLLGKKLRASSGRARAVALLGEVANRFVAAYGVPLLGNRANPVDELFYILLSARTPEIKYLRCYRELRNRYPRLEDLATTSLPELRSCIRDLGLANKRSKHIKRIARRLIHRFGTIPTRALRRMSAEDVYLFLVGLPGIAAKSALCVMMYSLSWDVFPVDVHARRIATRLGVLPRGLDHRAAQAVLPGVVPEGRSKELHVGFVVHGREVCLPRRPACNRCMLLDLCRFGKAELRRRRK
jgi:endonuclease III